jgi:2-phosphosulfolactate phosphatase
MEETVDSRPRIEVCFSPNLYPLHRAEHEIIVVIDVLRATSAICAAFQHGVRRVIPTSTVDEALAYRSLADDNYILAAERGGKIVEGFEFGNSPYSYMDESVKGKTLVLTTTNGTKTINVAKDADTVVIGSLNNLEAICEWLKKQKRNTLCLCSGWQDKFNLEDTICAGAIADSLIKTGEFRSVEDSSIAAKYLFQSATDNYLGFLKASSHRRRLKKLNLNDDIKYCLTPNTTDVIPILKNGELVLMQQETTDED